MITLDRKKPMSMITIMIKTMFIKIRKKGSQQTFFLQKKHIWVAWRSNFGVKFSVNCYSCSYIWIGGKKHTLFTDRKKNRHSCSKSDKKSLCWKNVCWLHFLRILVNIVLIMIVIVLMGFFRSKVIMYEYSGAVLTHVMSTPKYWVIMALIMITK